MIEGKNRKVRKSVTLTNERLKLHISPFYCVYFCFVFFVFFNFCATCTPFIIVFKMYMKNQVPRSELLSWINSFLCTSYPKLEDASNGIISSFTDNV